ncbi:MAG: cysteine desulfurase [Ruminococcus sp.]|nr:cysteine desulfurase [Ruminococcus sp.]
MEKRFVYADNASTTKISPGVLDAMMPYLTEQYGNASSVYSLGRKAKIAVETAREKTALALGCQPSEIFFTSGGTEADNLAIYGICRALASQGKNHIITTAIEHPAVLNTCKELEKNGFDVTYIFPDVNGIIDPSDIKKAITCRTALVSVMYANNETGAIQPVNETALICKEKNVFFHTDAVQAVGQLKINTAEQNIDLLSVSGHKLHAPKGTGALYIRKGLPFYPLFSGGNQEKGIRPGTENTASIAGFGYAMEEAMASLSERYITVSMLRDRLTGKLLSIPGVTLNGDKKNRLPGHCNVSVSGIDAEGLLLMLDLKGICASAGSACTSEDSQPSHVLRAMGISKEAAKSSVRFSLGDDLTAEDTDYIAHVFAEAVKKLRKK